MSPLITIWFGVLGFWGFDWCTTHRSNMVPLFKVRTTESSTTSWRSKPSTQVGEGRSTQLQSDRIIIVTPVASWRKRDLSAQTKDRTSIKSWHIIVTTRRGPKIATLSHLDLTETVISLEAITMFQRTADKATWWPVVPRPRSQHPRTPKASTHPRHNSTAKVETHNRQSITTTKPRTREPTAAASTTKDQAKPPVAARARHTFLKATTEPYLLTRMLTLIGMF